MIRFVVNGANRTGTHFLQSLLNDHPDIACYWDIFWAKDETPLGYASYLKKVGQPNRLNIFAKTRILYNFLTDHYARSGDFKAAGFLLKTGTAANNPAIIRWIRNNDVKIIHLVRENFLMQEVAKEIRRQKLITSHVRTPTETVKVKLNTEKLLRRLESEERSLEKHRKRLTNTDVLEIKYEDLIHNEKVELVRIFDFLDVNIVLDIKSEFHKTETESPRAMIENYNEVATVLDGTQFSNLLD